MSRRPRAVALFLAWACVGAIGTFGVAALLTIGIVFVLAAALLAAGLLWRAHDEWAPLVGLGLGAALVVAYVGWLNRDGPGNVCQTRGTSITCTEEWAPWPFYVVAGLLAASSVALFVRFRPRRSATRSA